MRKVYKSLAVLAAGIFAVACGKEVNEVSSQIPEGMKEVAFAASSDVQIDESKTTYNNLAVLWEANDKVSLFSGDNFTTHSDLSIKQEGGLSEDCKFANFVGLADAESTSYIAVYPYSSQNNVSDGSSVTVTIPTEQVAVAGSFASGANVSVAYSEDAVLAFRNVGALIGFRFQTDADAERTKSVTFKAKKSNTEYYGLSGAANVTWDAESKHPMPTEGAEGSVTLVAPEGGFESATTYYVVVYPGAYEGLEIVYTDKNDSKILRSTPMSVTLLRNHVLNIGHLVEPYDTLPEEVKITLDFTKAKWPFNETIVASANQSASGDPYTYDYKYDFKGEQFTEKLNFAVVKSSGANYSHNWLASVSARRFQSGSAKGMCVVLPGIQGMYLKSVAMSHSNSSAKTFRLQLSPTDAGANYSSPSVTTSDPKSPVETKIEFPTVKNGDGFNGNLVTTALGKSYCMYVKEGTANITSIEVVYTKTQPAN